MLIRSHKELEHKVIIMHAEGWSIRELSRRFHLGRNTIRRILRDHASRRDQGHDILTKPSVRLSKLDVYAPLIKETLEKYPTITGLRVYEKLKDAGYTGGITIVREQLRKLGAVKREPVIRFETGPAQQAQMDWSPYTIHFTRTGKMTVLCFSYILGYSRRQYIDFTLRRDFHTLIRRHQDAFQYYGGVAMECLYDNEKTVVLRWEAGRPIFNPAFADFITFYRCKPIACRPRTPQTKGKIEAPFKYVESNLLGGRDFQDIEDLRATARWWLKEKSDLHIHDTTRRAPIELFQEEKQKLQPLPLHPYDTSEVAIRVCEGDGFIEFEVNWYSVPPKNIADIVTLKATEREVLIYSPELELIARHERQPAGSRKRMENPEHFVTKKNRYGLEPVREAFIALGDGAESFLAGLTNKQPRNCGFHARFILRLREEYQSEDINNALKHAERYQAYEGGAVERILKAKATPRTLESIRNEHARQELGKTLPRITQRSLDEYQSLMGEEKNHHEQKDDDAGRNGDEHQETSCDSEADGNTEGS